MLNNSADNVADKDFTTVDTLTGTMRNETSLTDPVVRCEFSGAVPKFNYFYIPQFYRYYFLKDVRLLRDNIYEMTGHCDVLTTALKLDNLSACGGIVKKQETLNNLLLNDGSFRVYQDPKVSTQVFPQGFNTFSYVLAVAGARSTT
jgi:hypothetical protein